MKELLSLRRNKSIKLVLAIISLVLNSPRAFTQEGTEIIKPPSFTISVSSGFTTYYLSDVRDFYHGVLEVYHANKVPIPTQREFPGNLLVGLNFLYTIPFVGDIGLGSQYTWTRAFSAYEDYSGKLDVNAKVTMLTLEAIIQRDIVTRGFLDMCVGARGGLVFGWSKFSQIIVFSDFPNQNVEILLSGGGKGYSVEGFSDLKRRFGNLIFGLRAGYRYANISEMDADLSLNGQAQSGTLQLKHNLSGFQVSAHVDFILE